MRNIMLIAPLLLLTGCSHMANDSWSGQDKAQHFLASAMLSAAGNEYAQHQGYSRDRSGAIGFMFSVSLGASKELWDNRLCGMAAGTSINLQAQPFTFTMQRQRDQKSNRPHDGHVPVKSVLNSHRF